MKTAAIYLHGVPGVDTPEAIKTVQYIDIADLKLHLAGLQEGYCDNDGERPFIKEYKHPKTGKLVIDCYSDADFHYVALCGFKIKESANKPTESI